jgi:TolA-binding protein
MVNESMIMTHAPRPQASCHHPRWIAAISVLALLSAAPTAAAQEAAIGKRVEKLEKEMRAVQRSVFPGGAPAFFEGEIAPDAAPGERAAASSPIADLTARVDALETQLRTVTEQSEQNAFKLREMERQLAALKADTNKRFDALEAPADVATPTNAGPAFSPSATGTTTAAAAPPKAVATPTAAAPKPATPAATTPKPVATTAGAAPRTTAPPATAIKPTAERVALVKAVPVPATGNAVEDGYSYGYRLWDAKLFPEAQAQLKLVVERNPKHRLASYAQNLLGRAYLDEGKPSLAAVAFYNNYKDRPDGERAPHSLMFMGVALDKLGRKADACKAFRELEEVYGERAPKDVRTEAAAAKTKAGC